LITLDQRFNLGVLRTERIVCDYGSAREREEACREPVSRVAKAERLTQKA